jgi:hypothetical protein
MPNVRDCVYDLGHGAPLGEGGVAAGGSVGLGVGLGVLRLLQWWVLSSSVGARGVRVGTSESSRWVLLESELGVESR